MKMVKSLLLGSAASVVAVAGAQAADLPVKAKAVEYVKICSLYGAGFYYIPGTDICMKVGGYVRFQNTWTNGGSNISNGPITGTGGRDTRLDSQDSSARNRVVATFDTRQQTQYGVLRTYLLLGYSQDVPAAGTLYATRGFIQIAGFTFGKATSYWDFMPRAALSYNAGLIYAQDTGDAGQILAAYTAQFGGGISATISAEQSARSSTVFAGLSNYSLGAAPTANNLGQPNVGTGNPDVVGNVRWDGTWGAFQLAAVLHDISGGYFGTSEATGHPSNKFGWGVSPGLRINFPMIGAGDYLVVNYAYTVGAIKYATSGNAPAMLRWNGQSLGYGNAEDGVYAASGTSLGGVTASGSIQPTTAWSVAAAYEHFWTPALQTSIYGSYVKVSHNDEAKGLICGSGTGATGAFPASSVGAGCSPDWSSWNIGSRTQWNVVRGLYVGLDVIYMKLISATPNSTNTLVTGAANGSKPASSATQPYTIADQSTWALTFRVHRDIVP